MNTLSIMTKFLNGLLELAKRKPTPSEFNSAQWQTVPPAIRQKAFFSATVNSAKVLTRWRAMLLDWLDGATEKITLPNGEVTTAFKEVSLAKFRERGADFAIKEGLATSADFKDQKITNVISNARLALVFNTNTEMAQEFAYWKERVGNPTYINKFPAAEFVRRPGGNPKQFRQRHVANDGVIARWDDLSFWLSMNQADDGGFQVPWGPWGYNSYMRQRPVSRKKAIALGLVRRNEIVRPPDVRQYGVTFGDQFIGDHEPDMNDVPDEIQLQARKRIVERLGPGALNADGNPSLAAFREARRRIALKYQ